MKSVTNFLAIMDFIFCKNKLASSRQLNHQQSNADRETSAYVGLCCVFYVRSCT